MLCVGVGLGRVGVGAGGWKQISPASEEVGLSLGETERLFLADVGGGNAAEFEGEGHLVADDLAGEVGDDVVGEFVTAQREGDDVGAGEGDFIGGAGDLDVRDGDIELHRHAGGELDLVKGEFGGAVLIRLELDAGFGVLDGAFRGLDDQGADVVGLFGDDGIGGLLASEEGERREGECKEFDFHNYLICRI